jgi:Transcription factor zinc-finger
VFWILEGTMPELDLTGFGVPALLIGAVVVITMATCLLHLLFPPAKSVDSRRTTPPNMPNRCPSCQQGLDKVERHGIQIEICPRCQGVWLSQDKLEQIIN